MNEQKSLAGLVLILLLLIGLGIQVLFDPLSSLKNWSENVQAHTGLPAARAQWQAQKITHYAFELRAYQEICWVIYARIEVRDEKVIRVNYIDFETHALSPRSMPALEWDQNPDWSDSFLCNYANFTMPQLFDRAELQVESIYDISFDHQYGFISEVHFGKPNGRGLLSPRMSSCCTGFVIQNFQILEE